MLVSLLDCSKPRQPPPRRPVARAAPNLRPSGAADRESGGVRMATIEKSIDVEAPLRAVYNQWTQFEEFPRFMEGVEEVSQLDDRRLLWRANVGGKVKEWEAEITEQRPDERIAWRSRTGARNAGVVTFHRLSDDRTRIMLQLEYEPEGLTESVGDAVGLVASRVGGDLQHFKEFIEARGQETGGWRGEIDRPDEGGQIRRSASRVLGRSRAGQRQRRRASERGLRPRNPPRGNRGGLPRPPPKCYPRPTVKATYREDEPRWRRSITRSPSFSPRV